ncbi:hypothetical protein DINM_004537 [Dirofilaria immitis]|nr:hypothetical protein [Dirofilaria immitis]
MSIAVLERLFPYGSFESSVLDDRTSRCFRILHHHHLTKKPLGQNQKQPEKHENDEKAAYPYSLTILRSDTSVSYLKSASDTDTHIHTHTRKFTDAYTHIHMHEALT